MSLRSLTWALEHQHCPSASAKLVLIVYANYMNARGWSYPSTNTIAKISGLNKKTVRSSIDALERAGILIDSGKRTGRTQQVKVYELALESYPDSGALDAPERPDPPEGDAEARGTPSNERLPKADPLKAPVFSGKGTQKRVAEPVLGTSTPHGAKAPLAPRGAETKRGSRIQVDWEAPPIPELPPKARACAEQWPSGAYEAEAEAFRNYWLGEGRSGARKLDWTATWCNRVIANTAKVLRDAKAGVKHEAPRRSASTEEEAASFDKLAAGAAKIGRDDDAAEFRRTAARIREAVGIGPLVSAIICQQPSAQGERRG